MAKRCEWTGDERRRKAEHGGVGTPHSRGASGMVIGSGAGEVGSFSWRSRSRRLVDSSVTRRRGGSSAHRSSGSGSGRDPGTGATSQRAIGPPIRAGGLMPRRGWCEFQIFRKWDLPQVKLFQKELYIDRGCSRRAQDRTANPASGSSANLHA